MTLTIELPPEVEKAARELAAEQGETLERWAVDALRRLTLPEQDGLRAFLENCPEDDEPETEEERERVRQAWAEYRRGAVVLHEDVFGRSEARERAA